MILRDERLAYKARYGIVPKLVSVARIELAPHAPKARMIPFHHTEFVAGALGLEPRPAQSKCAVLPLHYAPILVLLAGNDPTSRPYQERVLPLYYRSLVAMEGFEPPIFRV